MNYVILLTKAMKKTEIETLELSNRTKNCMMRAGIKTVGEVVKRWDKIGSIRGMGETSIKELGNKIMNFSLENLSDEKLRLWWKLNYCKEG